MKPATFNYIRAEHADEAVALLAEYGDDARILAGGQSLMPMLNMRLAQPAVLIDISQCDDLNFIRSENNELRVGAATTQAALEWRKELAVNSPLLALAFPHISHFQIRNRGTVCGSIAHADPSAELPLCLVALGGSVALRTRHGSRTVAANDFFQGVLTTAREPDELIEAVHFPLAKPQTRYGFAEFSIRHGDYAIVAVAAVADRDGITLAAGGIADRPVSQYWRGVSGDALDNAVGLWADSLEANDNQHASAYYRRHLLRTLAMQSIAKLAAHDSQ